MSTTWKSTFSITAPRFSDEDEKRELEELTPEERTAIHDDIYGSTSRSEIVEIDPDNAWSLVVEQALGTVENRVALERALQYCPELVRTETHPANYLRCCDLDPWAAAAQLARHWETRVQIYGDNRAFLPLHLNRKDGCSAVSDEAIQWLETCIFTALGKDTKNRVVIYYDRSKLVRTPGNDLLQALFYLMSVVSRESEHAQQNGIVVIIDGRRSDTSKFNRKFVKKGLDLCSLNGTVYPCEIKAIHACLAHSQNAAYSFVIPVVKFILGKYFRRRLLLHFGTEGQVTRSLESHGMQRDILPTQVGGDLDVASSHQQWMEKNRSRERQFFSEMMSPNVVGIREAHGREDVFVVRG